MPWIVIALLSIASAQDTPPKAGHTQCIQFLNQNFGENGKIRGYPVLFKPDGGLLLQRGVSTLKAPSATLDKLVFFSKTPEAPKTRYKSAGGDVDYQLYYDTNNGRRFSSFQVAQDYDKKQPGPQFRSANVEFGWNGGDCVVTKLTRTSEEHIKKADGKTEIKRVTNVYPNLDQCQRLASAGTQTNRVEAQGKIAKEYLNSLKNNEVSPILDVADFDGTKVQIDRFTLVCQETYAAFLASGGAAGSAQNPKGEN